MSTTAAWWRPAFITVFALLAVRCGSADALHAPAASTVAQPSRMEPPTVPQPNPILLNIPPNTALDLGRYTCHEPADRPAGCEAITDYSGFRYDYYGHRMLMFGGGHGPAVRTDIDAFDLRTLTWTSLYHSTPLAAMTEANLDTKNGAWASTGQPVVRHTYDMLVVAEVADRLHFIILTSGGIPSRARIAHYDLLSPTPTWTYSRASADTPWYYAAAAEYDPESKKIFIIGLGINATPGSLWRYDPVTQTVDTVVNVPAAVGYANNLVYFPPNRKMYLIARGSPTRVFEVTLNRNTWSRATVAEVTRMRGDIPDSEESGWAYDSANGLIGGGIRQGTFYAYDPVANRWISRRMLASSREGASIGTVAFHALDYDPINHVYVFITDEASGRRTWAFRLAPP